MKRSTKIWLIVAAALVLLGGLVLAGTLAKNGWDLAGMAVEELESRTYDIDEGFNSISIRADSADIAFVRAENGQCRVEVLARKNEKHIVTVRDGTFLIEQQDEERWYERVSPFNFARTRITVWLPASDYAALSVRQDTGDLTVPEDFAFETASVSASTGELSFRASVSETAELQTSTGDILVENSSVGELRVTVSTGEVTLRSLVCEGRLSLTVSTGKAELTDVSCQSFVSGGSTGDLRLERVLAAGTISVERGTGDVRLEECDAAELYIQTDTGSVTGTLNTEKLFQANSHTGRVSVPDTITGGLCRISTNTGNIEITVP